MESRSDKALLVWYFERRALIDKKLVLPANNGDAVLSDLPSGEGGREGGFRREGQMYFTDDHWNLSSDTLHTNYHAVFVSREQVVQMWCEPLGLLHVTSSLRDFCFPFFSFSFLL